MSISYKITDFIDSSNNSFLVGSISGDNLLQEWFTNVEIFNNSLQFNNLKENSPTGDVFITSDIVLNACVLEQFIINISDEGFSSYSISGVNQICTDVNSDVFINFKVGSVSGSNDLQSFIDYEGISFSCCFSFENYVLSVNLFGDQNQYPTVILEGTTVNLSANVNSSFPISVVDLYKDDVLFDTDVTNPFQYSDTILYGLQPTKYQSIATDSIGISAISNPLYFIAEPDCSTSYSSNTKIATLNFTFTQWNFYTEWCGSWSPTWGSTSSHGSCAAFVRGPNYFASVGGSKDVTGGTGSFLPIFLTLPGYIRIYDVVFDAGYPPPSSVSLCQGSGPLPPIGSNFKLIVTDTTYYFE